MTPFLWAMLGFIVGGLLVGFAIVKINDLSERKLRTEIDSLETENGVLRMQIYDREKEVTSLKHSQAHLKGIVHEIARITNRDQNSETVAGAVRRVMAGAAKEVQS